MAGGGETGLSLSWLPPPGLVTHTPWNSIISLSDFSLLVYGSASDFCICMIVYPATLLNSLISSTNFLILSLGFSIKLLQSCSTL